MTYVCGWLGLVVISLLISLVTFVWAVKSGQFGDQQRLRYLPLRNQPVQPPLAKPGRWPFEVYVLFGIGACVITVFLAAAFLSLYH
jgi:nitrogen fixation-related uncharacterized protein